jgi:hypothetical protein
MLREPRHVMRKGIGSVPCPVTGRHSWRRRMQASCGAMNAIGSLGPTRMTVGLMIRLDPRGEKT